MRLSYRVNIFSRPRIAALVIKSHETDNNTTQHTHSAHTHTRTFGATAKGFLHTPQTTPHSPLHSALSRNYIPEYASRKLFMITEIALIDCVRAGLARVGHGLRLLSATATGSSRTLLGSSCPLGS